MIEQAFDSDPDLNCAVHETPAPPLRAWRAGDLVVDIELRRLQRAGERVNVQDVPLRLLCLLLQREGRAVARRELHELLWPRYDWDSFERNLNTAVRKLRRAIGDDAREPHLIETLRASGYRWIGPTPKPLAFVPEDHTGIAESNASAVSRPAPLRTTVGRGLRVALAAFVALAACLAAGLAFSPARPWIMVTATSSGSAPDDPVRALQDLVAAAIVSGMANDGGEPLRLTISRNGRSTPVAQLTGRGAAVDVALDEASFGRERTLAEIASRLPAAALRSRQTPLPPAAERAFADAGGLMLGPATVAPVDRAIALLDSVLSVAPDHAGALRMYARAQRLRALIGRDRQAAAERRALARAALRRAAAADPASPGVAVDIASQLVWADGAMAAAADWFALARREAPQDAEILHAYAWFALADDRVDAAMRAMNAALAIAPLSDALHADLGWFYFRTGRYDDALRQCRLTLEMAAGNESAQICEERALAELGREDQAWESLRAHAPKWLDAGALRTLAALAPGEAYRAAMRIAARSTRDRLGPGFDSACLAAIAGDYDAAAADLAAAAAIGDPGLRLARVTPEIVRLLGVAGARRLARFDAPAAAPVDSG